MLIGANCLEDIDHGIFVNVAGRGRSQDRAEAGGMVNMQVATKDFFLVTLFVLFPDHSSNATRSTWGSWI